MVRSDSSANERILAFMRDFYAIDAYPFDEHIARTTLTDLIHTPAFGRVWLIAVDGTPVGYVALTLGYSLEYHGRDAFIDEIYIQADQRGKGIGTQAMAGVCGRCVSRA
ncbi:MAG: GNAT family N-acetyltransferase [Ktedonobacterales bacterium]